MKLRHLLPSRRRADERDMREELEALERIAGRRELGNLTRAAEDARAVWGWPAVEGILADVRFALRTLRKQPSFTAVAVVSLALAIGANAAIFSLMDALLWRDLPVRDPDRLVALGNSSRSYVGYLRFAENAGQVMESVAAECAGLGSHQLDTGGGSQSGSVVFVTGNYFQTLGVSAAFGRAITPEDDRLGAPTQVAVLSQQYWRRAYGGDRSAVGRSIRLGKAPYTIVGVAPAEFFGLTVGEVPDVWVPVTTLRSAIAGGDWLDPHSNLLQIIGRLRPGIDVRQADAVLAPVVKQFELDHNGKANLEPLAKGVSALRTRFSKPLRVVLGMVAIGLLLACVNVMSLQFARMDERRKELTVRLAIGASRFRVARQLLIESLLLAVAGGAIGLAIYRPISAGLASLITTLNDRPVQLNLGIDTRMLALLLGVSLTAALLSGLLPALRATGDVHPSLQQGSRAVTPGPRRRTLGRVVAATQLALSMVLVAGACLFVFSLHQLRTMDVGMNRERLVVVNVDSTAAGYKREVLAPLNGRLRDRLATVPGVEFVVFSQDGLYHGTYGDERIEAGNSSNLSARDRQAVWDVVGPGFFSMIGARMAAGREFEESDRADPNVAVVNREFARHFFGASSPVGQIIRTSPGDTFRVIGVVEDVRGENLRRTLRPRFYVNDFQTQIPPFTSRFLVRTKASPLAVVSGLREAVRLEDSALAAEINTADELLDKTLDIDRLIASLAWGFGVLAILLAAVGIYGLFSYEVTRRTSEIGIRMAVGAAQIDILGMILREVALICIVGVAMGTAAALGLSRVATSLVFGVKPDDPRIAAAAAIILVAVAVCAAWLPGRRAARLDPMVALRVE